MRFTLSAVFLIVVLTGCMRQPQSDEPAGVDVTDVTDVTTATSPPATAAATSGAGQVSGETAGDAPPLNALNLALPGSERGEDASYLFAEKDETPRYFESQGNSSGVRLKGKLYMIDEPSAEKRMDNVDGGEIGIVVPLK